MLSRRGREKQIPRFARNDKGERWRGLNLLFHNCVDFAIWTNTFIPTQASRGIHARERLRSMNIEVVR